jgi:hypothetical protein
VIGCCGWSFLIWICEGADGRRWDASTSGRWNTPAPKRVNRQLEKKGPALKTCTFVRAILLQTARPAQDKEDKDGDTGYTRERGSSRILQPQPTVNAQQHL